MKKTFFIAIFSMSLFCNAQEDTTAQLLDSLVVTSQRVAQKQSHTPYTVHVLSQKELADYSPRTTPEALMMVNGVFVQKTNHGGGSPFLRGLTGNQTLILVDGIRLNNSTFRYGPNQYLNTIDPYSIQKIEVVKGTGSVQYGTDAVGGVIQILTNEPGFAQKNKWSGKATSKYMSGDMEKTVRGEGVYSAQKFAVQVGATYRNFGDLIGGDTTDKQSPSGYKELAIDLKTKIKLQSNLQLTLAHQTLLQQHVPVYHKVKLENFAVNEMDPQQRGLTYAKINWQTQNRLFDQIVFIASFQNSLEERISRKNNSTVSRMERDVINTAALTSDVFSRFKPWWTANTGIELYHDRVNSSREDINAQNASKTALRGLYPDDSRYGNFSVYSLHHFQLGKLKMEAGVRYNTFAIHVNDTSLGKVQITPSALVYNAAVLYALNRKHHLYASLSTGFRAPNIDDMGTLGIVDFRYETPAYNLHPESSQHTELGYKYNSRKLSATLAAYYMHLENLITRVKVNDEMINGYQVYQKVNVETAYIKGLEAEINWRITNKVFVRSGLSYTYGQNLTKKEPLRRMPPLNGNVMARYQHKRLFGAVEWFYASKQDRLAQGDKDDNRIPVGGTLGWNIINLYTGYQLHQVRLKMGLQNLFNVDYRTHGSGINGVGRSAWLAAVIHF